MKIITAQKTKDFEDFFQVLKELRPHLSFDQFMEIYQEAHATDGYEMVALVENETILALMGYRVLWDFVRGKHLYIDDLVSKEKSKGHGKRLLDYAEEKARELNCSGGLRLCAVLENKDGIRFYEKNGWKARAYAFVKRPQ